MVSATQPRPAVRLRAAPPHDPPFEDELQPETFIAGDRQLVLEFTPTDRPAAKARTPPAGNPQALPPYPVVAASPEARQAAKRFLGLCLEIFNGYRPAGHVRALSSPPDADLIIEQVRVAGERMAVARRAAAPARPARAATQPGGQVRLRLLRVCEPRPGVAEAAASLGTAGRTWAIAFRLERRRGTWVATTARVL